ncbi:MAG: hypothetical protein FWC26_00755, partial [Fibromonadales bacterium]|nr:hypothetical protein [Fibromonadales bacterium]
PIVNRYIARGYEDLATHFFCLNLNSQNFQDLQNFLSTDFSTQTNFKQRRLDITINREVKDGK